jgi:peroxiredoxin Q/BCP
LLNELFVPVSNPTSLLLKGKSMKFLLIILLLGVGLFLIRSSYANSIPAVGSKAPAFDLPDAKNEMRRLADYQGKWLILYFYPKDDTPGCTKEACHFRDDLAQLTKLGGQVVGVSVDDTSAHADFAKKYNLPFPLLSDKDGKVAANYGALTDLGLFKMAKRYTFLIDPNGLIAKQYLSVDTSRHSQEIIDDLKELSGQ